MSTLSASTLAMSALPMNTLAMGALPGSTGSGSTGFDALLEALAAVCLVAGALMSLGAAVGLLRFPDLLSRMHAATKPQVLGLLLLLAAVGIQLRAWALLPLLVVAWLFQLLTVPVSAHMVGRAGYRTKRRRPDLLSTDELDDVVAAAAAERDPSAGKDDDGP